MTTSLAITTWSRTVIHLTFCEFFTPIILAFCGGAVRQSLCNIFIWFSLASWRETLLILFLTLFLRIAFCSGAVQHPFIYGIPGQQRTPDSFLWVHFIGADNTLLETLSDRNTWPLSRRRHGFSSAFCPWGPCADQVSPIQQFHYTKFSGLLWWGSFSPVDIHFTRSIFSLLPWGCESFDTV